MSTVPHRFEEPCQSVYRLSGQARLPHLIREFARCDCLGPVQAPSCTDRLIHADIALDDHVAPISPIGQVMERGSGDVGDGSQIGSSIAEAEPPSIDHDEHRSQDQDGSQAGKIDQPRRHVGCLKWNGLFAARSNDSGLSLTRCRLAPDLRQFDEVVPQRQDQGQHPHCKAEDLPQDALAYLGWKQPEEHHDIDDRQRPEQEDLPQRSVCRNAQGREIDRSGRSVVRSKRPRGRESNIMKAGCKCDERDHGRQTEYKEERFATHARRFYHWQESTPCYTAACMVECEGALHPRAREGLRLFNEGRYFEAHEELEAAWKDERGRVRELYQGILEAAVTYLHIRRGNFAGAVKVYGRSMRWLRTWPEICRGTNVGQLRSDLDAAIAEVHRLGEARIRDFDQALFRPVIWREVSDG